MLLTDEDGPDLRVLEDLPVVDRFGLADPANRRLGGRRRLKRRLLRRRGGLGGLPRWRLPAPDARVRPRLRVLLASHLTRLESQALRWHRLPPVGHGRAGVLAVRGRLRPMVA